MLRGSSFKNFDALREVECLLCSKPAAVFLSVYSRDLCAALTTMPDPALSASLDSFDNFLMAAIAQADTFQPNPHLDSLIYSSDQCATFSNELEDGGVALDKIWLWIESGLGRLRVPAETHVSCRRLPLAAQLLRSILELSAFVGLPTAVRRSGKVGVSIFTLHRLLLACLLRSENEDMAEKEDNTSLFFDTQARRLLHALASAKQADSSQLPDFFAGAIAAAVSSSH